MDEVSIIWQRLDDQCNEHTCTLRWRNLKMKVSKQGSVIIYRVPSQNFVRFPDLAELHASMEQAMGEVLGWFGEAYEGAV